MKRAIVFLVCVFAVSALVFSGGKAEKVAPGAVVEATGESPMLTARVNAGELPPRAERLPDNPRVVDPIEETGRYGGRLRFGFVGDSPIWGGLLYIAGWEMPFQWDPGFSEPIPNLFEGFDVNDDATEYTFYMRRGMRWSDGEPYTARDIMFYIDDVLRNEELYPGGFSAPWVPAVMADEFVATMIDDYTFRLTFPESFGFLPMRLTIWDGRAFATYPAHYLKQFHKEFNPNIQELIDAEEGVEDWVGLFFRRGPGTGGGPDRWFDDPDYPTLGAFKVTQPMGTGSRIVLERNPYYWKVDTAGNQLPYMDSVLGISYQDAETRSLAMLNGDLDYIQNPPGGDRALFVNAMRQGSPLRIFRTVSSGANSVVLQFNMTARDPVKRDVFSNKDFRIGVSHALDRDELRELFAEGQGWNAQIAPHPDSPLYNEQLANQYLAFDRNLANEYLDKVVPRRDSRGMRTDPDGNQFRFVLAVRDEGHNARLGEVLVDYMREVGLDARLNAIPGGQFDELRKRNDLEVALSYGEGGAGLTAMLDPRNFVPGEFHGYYVNAYALWYINDPDAVGAEEPPQWVIDARAQYEYAIALPTLEQQMAAMHEVLKVAADRFYHIGAYQGASGYQPVHSRVRNLPEAWYGGWIEGVTKLVYPEQWYLTE